MSHVLFRSVPDPASLRDRLEPGGPVGAGATHAGSKRPSLRSDPFPLASTARGPVLSRVADPSSPPDGDHLSDLTRELRRLRRRQGALAPLAFAANDARSPRIARARMRIVRRRMGELARRRADALTETIDDLAVNP